MCVIPPLAKLNIHQRNVQTRASVKWVYVMVVVSLSLGIVMTVKNVQMIVAIILLAVRMCPKIVTTGTAARLILVMNILDAVSTLKRIVMMRINVLKIAVIDTLVSV